MSSLKSITQGRINDRLCLRHGYASRSAAVRSHKQLIVEIASTDADLVALGQIITEAAENDVLPFLQLRNQRDAWTAVTTQLERFHIKWQVIPADSPTLKALREWAERVLVKLPHNGPVFSPATPMTKPSSAPATATAA